MAHAVFTNNARTTLSGSLTNVATSASVVDGSVFPAPTGGDYAYLTIEEGVLVEIVKLTARSTNTLTITRAQDGTTGQAFTTAATVSLRLPRIVLDEFQAAIDGKQTQDAELSAIAGLTSAADRLPYFTGSGTAALATFTSAGRALVDDADAAAQRTTLGVAIGTNVQAYDAGLQSIAGLTTLADRSIYTTASDTYAVYTLTAAGRAILDDADASAQRTTLGLGTAAVKNTGTSGDAVPLLNGANTWSAAQTFSATENVIGADATTTITVSLRAAQSGSNAGFGYFRRNVGAGTTAWALGDYSVIYGGAWDGRPTLFTSNVSTLPWTINGNLIWHAGNDGAGSGLDADLLDGYNVGTSGAAIPLLNGANSWSSTNQFTLTGTSGMATTTASVGRPEVFNNSTGGAFMTFHRTGSFAGYLGLDTDNVLKWGGWSVGAAAYPVVLGGYTSNNTTLIMGTSTTQTDGTVRTRKNGNNFEWGHTNTAGYHGTLGSFSGAGDPYISFNAEHGTNSNTFRTRGRFGGAIYMGGGDGRMHFGHLAAHTADNQTLAIGLTLDINGNLGLGTTSPTNFGAGWRALTIGESGKNGVVRLTSGTVTADMFTDTTALYIRTASSHSMVLRTNDTDRLTIDNTGQVTLTNFNPTSEFAAGFRGAPVNRQDSSYTLVLADSGKTILKGTNTASQTYTIPANSSVAYPVGTILTFANLGNVSCSIAITTDPMYLSPGGSTGTRTLAAFGMATAVKVTSTNWMISGAGLT